MGDAGREVKEGSDEQVAARIEQEEVGEEKEKVKESHASDKDSGKAVNDGNTKSSGGMNDDKIVERIMTQEDAMIKKLETLKNQKCSKIFQVIENQDGEKAGARSSEEQIVGQKAGSKGSDERLAEVLEGETGGQNLQQENRALKEELRRIYHRLIAEQKSRHELERKEGQLVAENLDMRRRLSAVREEKGTFNQAVREAEESFTKREELYRESMERREAMFLEIIQTIEDQYHRYIQIVEVSKVSTKSTSNSGDQRS